MPRALVRCGKAGVRDLVALSVVSRLLLGHTCFRSPSLQLILSPPRISVRLVVRLFSGARTPRLRRKSCYFATLLPPIVVIAESWGARADSISANRPGVFPAFLGGDTRRRERRQR